MMIGFTENYIGKDKVVLWFYKKVENRWYKVHSETVDISTRAAKLKEVLSKASLVPVGRGT